MTLTLTLALHALAAVIWVGGMFFAYVVLRPVAGAMEPPDRLRLWRGVFQKFFVWVWASAAVLLTSGYVMVLVFMGGMGAVGRHVHAMNGIGILMMLIFAHLYFAPWRRFKAAVDGEIFDEAGTHLNTIRIMVRANLILGLATVLIGASGRYWS